MQGRMLFIAARYEEAIPVLESLERLAVERGDDRQRIFASEYLGRVYSAQGRTELAEKVLRDSARLMDELKDPEGGYWGCPYQALGELYSRQGRSTQSAAFLRKMADFEATVATSQFDAAVSFFVLGEFADALEYLGRGLKLEHTPAVAEFEQRVRGHQAQAQAGTPPPPAQLAYEAALVSDRYRSSQSDAALRYAERAVQLADRPEHRALVESLRRRLSAAGTFDDAVAAFATGQYDVARGITDRLVQGRCTAGDLVLHGLVLLFEKRYDGALESFDYARKLDPHDPGPDAGVGHERIARRDYEAAGRLLSGVLAKLDARPRDRAPTAYERLVDRTAALGLGWVASNQSRFEQALSFFDRVLADRADDVFALLGKGNALSGLRRMTEASALFQRVLEVQPDNPYALAEMGLVDYNRGDLAAAEQGFRKALEGDSQRYTCPYDGLGLVYLRQGRLAEARENFERAIRINPDIEYKKFNGLARIFIAQGDYGQARSLLRKAIENYPYDGEAAQLLASLPAAPSAAR